MGLEVRTVVEFTCDADPMHPARRSEGNYVAQRDAAKAAGWHIHLGKVLCPSCAPKPKIDTIARAGG